MALSLAHGPGQVAGHFRPNSIGAKPVVPPSHRFPGAKILREIRPGATSPLQIETGIDHFPQIHHQSGVSRENHLDRFPFRVGKIAWVAAVVIFVLFAISRCPHRSILPSASTEREESQSKGLSVSDRRRTSSDSWIYSRMLMASQTFLCLMSHHTGG